MNNNQKCAGAQVWPMIKNDEEFNEYLAEWLFFYNAKQGLWKAVLVEDYNAMLLDPKLELNVITGSSIYILTDYIAAFYDDNKSSNIN